MRRMSSSLFAEDMGPQTTSSQPLRVGTSRITHLSMRGAALRPAHTARMDVLQADGVLLGVAPAEPFAETERHIAERRAQGLFGDLRFTLTNTARSCHPERLVRGARSVIAVALPLWRPAGERPGRLYGRMPRYAWHDPYAPLRARLETLATRLRSQHGARATV